MPVEAEDLALWCDTDTFRPVQLHPVRWLDWESDFELAVGIDETVTRESWLGNRGKGFKYCAVVLENQALARAALWAYSDDRWEVAAVRTREQYRGLGMARSVVSFVTAHILDEHRIPTLHTAPTNLAMLHVAQSVGFRLESAELEVGGK